MDGRGTSDPLAPAIFMGLISTVFVVLYAVGLIPTPPTSEAEAILSTAHILAGGFISLVGGLLANEAGYDVVDGHLSMGGP